MKQLVLAVALMLATSAMAQDTTKVKTPKVEHKHKGKKDNGEHRKKGEHRNGEHRNHKDKVNNKN